MRRVAFGLSLLILFAIAGTTQATVYTVSPDGAGDFPTIQAAIDAAVSGDIIELTNGTFTGAGNRDLQVSTTLTIRSQSGVAENCVIDCQASSGDQHFAIDIDDNALGTDVARITFQNGWVFGEGGAVQLGESIVTFDTCVFKNNYAEFSGGAIYAPLECEVTILDCYFEDNRTNQGGTGGAIHAGDGSTVDVSYCGFNGNSADPGGTLYLNASSAVMENCTINGSSNVAIRIDNYGDLNAYNTIITNGTSAAVACDGISYVTMFCCDIYGNAGGDWVGCIDGQLGYDGNISEDPLYCGEPEDLRIHEGSPCAGDNHPTCSLIGAYQVACYPTTYVVNPEGTGDFPTIQEAVDAARPGDVIELTDGTFRGEGNRGIDFLGKSITVRSQNLDAESCIIDCEADDRGFYFRNQEDSTSVVEGVTVFQGYRNQWGGAVRCTQSSPTIRECIFLLCWSTQGAVYVEQQASPTFSYCTFDRCSAIDHGGAISVWSLSNPRIDHCTFFDSRSVNEYGSTIYSSGFSHVNIEDSILAFGGSGEVVRCWDDGIVTLTCCNVYGNAGGDYVGCIAGQLGLNDNVSVNPRFCNAAAHDLTLHYSSPCAPDNNLACGQVGAWGVSCGPSTWLVKPDGTGDFPTIQAAIDNVWDGDTIELADGTFTGVGNRGLTFLGKAVTVRSQSGNPTDCVIDCEDHDHGVLFEDEEDENSILEGVMVLRGSRLGFGGGIACEGSSPTIRNCLIAGCWSDAGAGFSANAGSHPTMSYCTLLANRSFDDGGAINVSHYSSLQADHCTLAYNETIQGTFSGIMVNHVSSVSLENSIIAFGVGGSSAGCGTTSSISLECCDVYGNDLGNYVNCIFDDYGVNGNIQVDPRFCHTAPLDFQFTIHYSSPCASENNPSCGLIGAWPVGCGPSTYVVKPDRSGDFPTIQEALDTVWDGDTIELTDGVFTGNENRDLQFHGKAVTVRSQNLDPESCIIDCELEERGFRFDSYEGPNSVLEGVTITRGSGGGGGGGIRCWESSPTIRNCVISECEGVFGAAIDLDLEASPTFSFCTIRDNRSSGDAGVITVFGGSTLHGDHLTLSGNGSVPGTVSGFSLGTDATLLLDNSIIAFGNRGMSILCNATATATLTCCNIYGNHGGDYWGDCIADQLGQNGNISEDPMFCGASYGNLDLQYDSPCAEENNPGCGQIGARAVGCAFLITSVEDVGPDQGGRVRVSWNQSAEDNQGTPLVVTEYEIWRRIDSEALKQETPRAAGVGQRLAYPPGDWDYVKSVPAHGEESYNTVCETLCDSTVTEGLCWSTFFIRAATDDPYIYIDCPPDSGYSVDNLAPDPPENLRWEEAALLAWEESEDTDFNYFTVYGSESNVFDPETAVLIEYTAATDLDVTGTDFLYYHTTATDFAGNEGEASTIQKETVGVEEVDALPATYTLHPCRPNPFNPSTMIRYDLPETAPVRLELFDINGRSVRILVDEAAQGPGQRTVEWNGRDDKGKTVRSGLYYYRFKAGTYSKTMRMVLLK